MAIKRKEVQVNFFVMVRVCVTEWVGLETAATKAVAQFFEILCEKTPSVSKCLHSMYFWILVPKHFGQN